MRISLSLSVCLSVWLSECHAKFVARVFCYLCYCVLMCVCVQSLCKTNCKNCMHRHSSRHGWWGRQWGRAAFWILLKNCIFTLCLSSAPSVRSPFHSPFHCELCAFVCLNCSASSNKKTEAWLTSQEERGGGYKHPVGVKQNAVSKTKFYAFVLRPNIRLIIYS